MKKAINLLPLLTAMFSMVVSSVFSGGGVKSPAEPHNTVRFTENKNQWEKIILYRAQLDGGALFLEKNCFTYNFYDKEALRHNHILKPDEKPQPIKFHAYKMSFIGANANPKVESKNPTPDYCNYFIGNDKTKWASYVHNYKEVVYENLYNGIDFQVLGLNNSIKYNFYVAPMADADNIQLLYEGLDNIELKNGALTYKTSINEIVEQKPFAYQWINGKKEEVVCHFGLEKNKVKFIFPKGYDKKYELVIDPILIFATSSGSIADNFGMTATYDATGHLYSGGTVFGAGYPVTPGAYDPTWNGGPTLVNGRTDVVITKFDPTGASLVYSTYLGGSVSTETVNSLIVNAQDELMLFGVTGSSDFPMVAGAYDNTFAGGTSFNYVANGTEFTSGTDLYAAKFSASGANLLASTFIGGTLNDGVNASVASLVKNYGDSYRGEIQVDNAGNFYISTCTYSTNFPVTAGVAQGVHAGGLDGIIFKMDPNLSTLIWSSYVGGSSDDACYALALDKQDNVYITGGTASTNFPITTGTISNSYGGGTDGFVTQIKNDGTSFLASTFVGTNLYDQSFFVQIDPNDDVYVLGQSLGAMPVTAGVYSNPNSGQFIWKMNPNLTARLVSTTFGSGTVSSGRKIDISPSAFLVDNCLNVFVSGWGGDIASNPQVPTTGMPITANAIQPGTDGYNFYLIVFSINMTSLYYATYFGGNISQEHVDGGTSRFDKKGIVYQAVCAGCRGLTTPAGQNNDDFPVTPGAWPNNGPNVNMNTQNYNCNAGTFKFDFQVPLVVASYNVNNSSGCAPLTATFSNQSTPGSTYTWVINPGNITDTTTNFTYTFTTPGTYTVCLYVNNTGTCNINDTACGIITVHPGITADFDFITIPCTNQVSFNDSSAVGPVSWAWDFDDGNSSTQQNPSHTYGSPGTYNVTLIATNQFGCKDTITYAASFAGVPPVTVSSDTNICVGANYQLSASGGFSYSWVPSATLNNANIPNPIATPTVTTTYTVTIQTINSLGDTCIVVDSATVNVFNPATYPLVATADDDTLTDGEFGTFIHAITPDTTLTISWSPSNSLNSSSIYNPYASPTVTTTYTVTITDTNGCSKSTTITIYVISLKCPPESVFVPNTFTPNKDGVNDLLLVRGVNISELYFAVYNRWGQLVFETTDINKGWDGYYKGMKVDPAVFAWYLRAKCYSGTELKKQGNTTLIR